MSERMLITKLVRTNGTTADLYARGHRWPDLKLFDISDLASAGIDFDAIEEGTETPCRFWAYYELSDKLNRAGNPYKNVVLLEPVDKPASTTSVDTSALLAELRAIRALLQTLVVTQDQANGKPIPVSVHATPEGEAESLDDFFPRAPTAPTECAQVLPAGAYEGQNLGWLLENDRDYLQRIADKANNLNLRNAAAIVLDWAR